VNLVGTWGGGGAKGKISQEFSKAA